MGKEEEDDEREEEGKGEKGIQKTRKKREVKVEHMRKRRCERSSRRE